MEIIFSNRAYASVLAETTEKIRTETGGLFLGAVRDGAWYVVEAVDPGPNSVFEVAYFEYDRAYTQHLIRKLANLYESRLELIGLWHRHPGSFDVFSSTDDGTNAKYAAMRGEGAVSALVNVDPDFRITAYHVAPPCRYSKIPYRVGDELIPPELLRLKTQEQFETLMRGLLSPRGRGGKPRGSAGLGAFLRSVSPCFDEALCDKLFPEPDMDPAEVGEKLLDVLMEDLSFFSDELGMEVSLSQRDKSVVLAQEEGGETTRVYFSYAPEEDAVLFEYRGRRFYYSAGFFKNAFARSAAERQEEQAAAPEVPAPETKQGALSGLLKSLFGGEKP